jgi:hypothetical protein
VLDAFSAFVVIILMLGVYPKPRAGGLKLFKGKPEPHKSGSNVKMAWINASLGQKLEAPQRSAEHDSDQDQEKGSFQETPRRIYDKSDASTEFAARSASSFACAITRTGVLSNM